MLLSREEIVKQSERAYKRWGSIWHENARENIKYYKDHEPIKNSASGGKAILLSCGPSLVENLKDIKANKLHYEYDILCIDKALKTCLEYGVVPKLCVVSDAQVDFDRHGKIPKEYCERIQLFISITGKKEWVKYWSENNGKVMFYVNKDNIRTHKVFGKYLKDKISYLIPASSNVGNALYVISVLIFGYRDILLAAYDYSYKLFGDYYGNQKEEPVDTNLGYKKHQLYNHYTMQDITGDLVQVSHNMQFSAKWLIDFVKTMTMQRGIKTMNITGAGILRIQNQAKLYKEHKKEMINEYN